ncbi:MAG: class I SAM-dependent methyltransferase [Betaproteobacteria bacterium]|jgi:2-polyprenyl-3-methyl-5-hydroxy-6-metoxy-1,4-benzoquinol methylase|nr:class I SAM-dependent methyltransferase [Betaproteobacteria bacterium]NCV87406.1 class I SAM-dependent methyltransferase [Oxalobacteraceae bacterium]
MNSFQNPLERWNSRFAEPGYLFGEEPNNYLREAQAYLKPGRCLMVADGEGRNGVWLAKQGHQVEGFDFSDLAIEKARALAKREQVSVQWEVCSWEQFNWRPERFDNVIGIFFQFAAPDVRSQIFANIDRALKPGGMLVIQGYTAKQLAYNTGGPGILEHMYDEALMRESFKNYRMLDLRTYETEIHEGRGHEGMSALLGMVAQKQN